MGTRIIVIANYERNNYGEVKVYPPFFTGHKPFGETMDFFNNLAKV